MIQNEPRFYFDAVDPLSFLVDREVRAVEDETSIRVIRIPFEIRPAPAELTDATDPVWAPRYEDAQLLLDDPVASRAGLSLRVPKLIPRSRKAHEFFLHAEESGQGAAALAAVFDTFFLAGRDIGRVDVLVEIGRGLGLDLTETKAVLDVDRYEAAAGQILDEARAGGIVSVPCLVTPNARLEGFHNQATIGTLLAGQ
jgi:predicted DsbA family dithiol-disulfide isomerase